VALTFLRRNEGALSFLRGIERNLNFPGRIEKDQIFFSTKQWEMLPTITISLLDH
jgi:hypothetical protein